MLFLLHADCLDLHQRAPGQRTHLHGGTGGILALGEKLGVHRVHGGEVAHALQEHGGLDHVVHGQAGGLQNGLDVGEHLTGLLGDAAGLTMDNVVKTTVFLQNMGDFAAMNAVYAEFFTEGQYPARSAVEVGALPRGALVEIETICVK